MSYVSPAAPGQGHLWQYLGAPDWCLPDRTISRFVTTGRPDAGFPREPWAAIATGVDGSIAATASPAFAGGLFWAEDEATAGLIFADNPHELVTRLGRAATLDPGFIRAYALLQRDMPSTATAFQRIHRIQPGSTLMWPPGANSTSAGWLRGAPRTVVWCGPDSWAPPTLEGPGTPAAYLGTFDAAIDELLVSDGPIYTHLSGGLDSTFVAASLARHASPGNPVHALCHSPSPEAALAPAGNWDPDDYPVAKAMAEAYPGRIVVHRVRPPVNGHPLDAAARAARLRGVPAFNPGNQVWMDQLVQLAADAGARRLFAGGNGNAAFSYDHRYAPTYYLRQGRIIRAWRSSNLDAASSSATSDLRRRVRTPLVQLLLSWLTPSAQTRLRRTLRRQAPTEVDYQDLIGLSHLDPVPGGGAMDREAYLRWLALSSPLRAALARGGSTVLTVDPFTTRSMLDFAAAITPLEWSRGGSRRGYARLLGQGRIPDSIRLRTRRGGQSWDEWFQVRNDRERYYDEVAALAHTPILGGWVDHRALQATLDSFPWGEVHNEARLPLLAMNRILSLGAFVRMATAWAA